MATVAFQYNMLSATAFLLYSPQDTIRLFLQENGVTLANDYYLIYSHLSEVIHCTNS